MNQGQKIPPQWWSKVINDLEKAVVAAKKSFNDPKVVLHAELDSEGKIAGYKIRLPDKKVGFYPSGNLKGTPPVGSVIKADLPEPEKLVDEPSMSSYTYGVISYNIRLVPKLWLNTTITKIFKGEPITMKKDLRPFPVWIALPAEKKQDKSLIDLLYRATRYEGLKGLARFDDIWDAFEV